MKDKEGKMNTEILLSATGLTILGIVFLIAGSYGMYSVGIAWNHTPHTIMIYVFVISWLLLLLVGGVLSYKGIDWIKSIMQKK